MEGGRLEAAHQSAARFYDKIAYDDDFNALALESSEGERVCRAMGNKSILFMANHGVMVTEVSEGPARSAGIREGDVVLMLNNVKVTSSAEFKRLASELPAGKAVSILVQRQGNPIFLALKTED